LTSSYAYFDTSVLVKTYVKEAGSTKARQLVRTRQVITSSITGLELLSAFKRNLTLRTIAPKAYSAIAKRLQQDRKSMRYVEITATVLERAEKYVSGFDIRALDAIHIASAMVSRERFPSDLPFITADARQQTVAAQLGLKVIWIRD
jgi:predicted nucleic acid-binding protein